jgi:hypothetical protein
VAVDLAAPVVQGVVELQEMVLLVRQEQQIEVVAEAQDMEVLVSRLLVARVVLVL